MTRTEHRRHLRHAKTLERPERPGTHDEHLWLLVPEGMDHDPELLNLAERLGANGIVSPHQGRSRLHQEAQHAGYDVSVPVLYRSPSPPRPIVRLSWWRRLWRWLGY